MVSEIVETEESMGIIDLDKTIETTIFEGTLENMEDETAEENIGIIGIMIDAGIDHEKGHSEGIMVTIEIEVPVIVDQGQDRDKMLQL